MREEVESAANFLLDLLSRSQDFRPLQLSSDQLKNFRSHLIHEFVSQFADHWFPERPQKGSAFRCLRINHKMDPLLQRVGRQSGLSCDHLRQLLPNEFTLWIDPQEVSYRIGENGSICHLLDDNPTTATTPERHQQLIDRQTPSPNASSMSSSAVSSLSSSPSLNWFSSSDNSLDTKSAFYLNSLLS